MKKIKTIFLFLLLAIVWNSPVLGQQKSNIETITLNPHSDVRIVFEQLKEQKIKHGKYTYFHRNIKIVEGNYLAGKKHGKWRRFFQNGNVSIDAFYLQGKKHGNWIYYFSDKSKMASVYFNRGKKKGEWTSWHHGSGAFSQLNFRNDSMIGSQKIYFHHKNLKMDAKSPQLHLNVNIRYKNAKKLVDYERYYPNGKLYEKCTEWGEKKVGLYTSFYYTALPWRKMKYEEDGRLYSIFEYNNPVGRDANRGSFRDGNGELISYNSNGNKFSKINYANGLKDGKLIIYEEDTKELITGYFNDGIRTGTWTQYKPRTPKKEVIVELHYTGKDTATGSFFKSSLHARDSGELIGKKKNGIWRTYYANNILKLESTFKMDFSHGTSKGIREDNQLDFTGSRYYGLKVGEWKYYNDFGKVIFREKFKIQASADESYLFGDSCAYRPFMEFIFYNTSKYVTKQEKQLTFIIADEKHINFEHFLFDGKYSSWPPSWKPNTENVEEYKQELRPDFPQFIPWEIEKRTKVVSDNDLGLFLETLNPRKLKVKGDKDSPKIGVAMVVLNIDEFGFVENSRIVRGIDPVWDQKIVDLFSVYQYWEPALFLGQPMAVALQIKVPIDLEVVKRME